MWRTRQQRTQSALERLLRAQEWWNWQPHPAQLALFSSDASVRVAACGRRWGKTESLSIDIATLALAERGSHQLIVAPTLVQARLLGDAVRDRLEQAFVRGGPVLEGRSLAVRSHPHLLLTIKEENSRGDESQISCRTAGRDGRSLRGLWAHRIIVDEAAYVPDRVLCEVLPPMLADKGGEFLLASSPNGRRSVFYRWYARGLTVMPRDGDSESDGESVSYAAFQCATIDNPHLDKAWLRAQRDDMGELLYAQEFEAKFIDDFGMVFREEDIEAAIAEIPGVVLRDHTVDSEPQRGHLYVAGIDWGRKYDYTVVAILDTGQSPMRLVHLSRRRSASWRAQAEEVAQILVRFGTRRILVDNNSMGDSVAEMLAEQMDKQLIEKRTRNATWHPRVDRYNFGSETKQTLIDKLNIGLSARALQFPPHPALVEELRNFEYAPGGPGRLKMAARAGGHDDCVIALALAFFTAPHPTAPRKNFGIMLGSQLGLGRREE
jgi:hypothetical protein